VVSDSGRLAAGEGVGACARAIRAYHRRVEGLGVFLLAAGGCVFLIILIAGLAATIANYRR
jgi:hypothetical protein